MIEYLYDPDATSAAVDAEGSVHTGDLGAMDERGYIRLTGRLKELIIRKGENIAPAEIESCLAAHPSIAGAAVVGLPDAQAGEIVAAVVLVRDQPALDGGGLRDGLTSFCSERLSPFKIPQRWFVASEFPLTPTQKVQKFRLTELAASGELTELA